MIEQDEKGRFTKGNAGGGRKIGSLNKSTLFKSWVDDDAEEIVRAIIKDAKSGCIASRKLFMERYFPVLTMQMQQIELEMNELRKLLENKDNDE